MKKIRVSMDTCEFWEKPTIEDVKKLSSRIAKRIKEIEPTYDELLEFARNIGRDGCTFCPATFQDKRRTKETFEQQQFFCLDFDNKDPDLQISVEEAIKRACHYELPPLFIYDTFSSKDYNKFRVVFLNDVSVDNRRIAEAMLLALGTIFPEADSSCYSDVSKLYFGGKELIYFNKKLSTINIESVFRNLTIFFKEKYKANHYKERLLRFSQKTGIALNKNGLLDICVSNNPTERMGATTINENGKKSPQPIIDKYNIIGNGEIFPNTYYRIKMNDCTSNSSVATSVTKTDVADKRYKNHKQYRAKIIPVLKEKCQLLNEFCSGKRRLHHYELYTIATNLIQVETGTKLFQEIQIKYPNYYDTERRKKWNDNLKYFESNNYQPTKCSRYCPYHKECNHNANILTTAKPKTGAVERVEGYSEQFYSLDEVQADAYYAIKRAHLEVESKVFIIKAMTSVGKTTSYLRLMTENFEKRFLIAAPTNLLKDEIYEKAKKLGLDVRKTPSLEQIKDKMPSKIWKKIQHFHAIGQHGRVHSYIIEVLEKENIPCLRKYMKEREELKGFHGSIITTHRYLLNMEEKRLQEYDAIIIDEDILFKSVVSNQGEITLSDLEKLSLTVSASRVREKIKKLLKLAQKQTCIELDGFEWEDESKKERKLQFDLPAFCKAEKFYIRKKAKDDKLKEDTVSFLKPVTFYENIKYIVVSATANEDIYEKYFGEERVDFYECKKARYKGILEQYPDKSMSRTSMLSSPGIIERLMKRFSIFDKNNIITFMMFQTGNLHYGNTEGSNTLEGQDILVVGTPYHADFLYKLAAFSMELAFDEEEVMERCFVEYAGNRFWFTTFKNENLRAIHFWMIESELEQAVGRARLLRNSCTVRLFSNFILSQAQIINGFDYNKE